MALLLGIDTGGTYTDAIVFDDESERVIASAKALTRKDNLSRSVTEASDAALAQLEPGTHRAIGFVALSTTLATNAIVENHGFPVALVMIGQDEKMLARAGLGDALAGDPVLFIGGGHNHDGSQRAPLDEAALLEGIRQVEGRAAAFAVCGYFAVRNPEHERRVRDLLREKTGLPVTCGHDLSGALDAPRRALTALLNARLIPMIEQLIRAVQGMLETREITAPLMVVKGDGSLIAAETALEKPVETILSGPAASVVGARFLSGEGDIVVADIGGTTTDIAVLQNGQPLLDPDGARVGGYRTMVEAVAVHTVGLGGDSEFRLDDRLRPILGPRRAQPLSLLALEYPATLPVLREQAERPWSSENDGRFALRVRNLPPGGEGALSRLERGIWEALATGPVALGNLLGGAFPIGSLRKLVDRGLVILSCFTPSDAAHVLGLQETWEAEAARLGAFLWARREDAFGKPLAASGEAIAALVYEQVILQSGEAIALAALSEELRSSNPAAVRQAAGAKEESRTFINRALAQPGAGSLLGFSLKLQRPLVGIGAPAATYYEEIAKRLGTRHVVPRFAEVCNAVGAVAGGVSQRILVSVTQPEEGRFRLHSAAGVEDFTQLDKALQRAEVLASVTARKAAETAGATEIKVELQREVKAARLRGDKEIFVEAQITARAYGRPRLTRPAA